MSQWVYNMAIRAWFHPAGISDLRGPESPPTEAETLAMLSAMPIHSTQSVGASGAAESGDCGCGGKGKRAAR